jgi:seryl-tRNA synthetase
MRTLTRWLRYIRGHRFNEAKETLNRLLSAAGEAEQRKFRDIQKKINSLDFEEAIRALENYFRKMDNAGKGLGTALNQYDYYSHRNLYKCGKNCSPNKEK